mmetsp:Transcript_26160/g.39202  ORF Transcript_26160/g.39202 Transcript_26160/m.39202 type:complete len:253 (+) Transcript_26160:2148-2906(+)
MQSKMNLSASLLLTIIASVQASFWPPEVAEKLAEARAAAKASRKLTNAVWWHETQEETVSEKPDNSPRMLKGKKDKKKPKTPKECSVISTRSTFPSSPMPFLKAWNMTESAIGENIVWDQDGVDDSFIAISVSTVVDEGPFINIRENSPFPQPPYYYPQYWSHVFTEVITYGNSTLTTSGTSSFVYALREFEIRPGEFVEMYLPTFSATATITGGTGDFVGAYGELTSLSCSVADYLNDEPCMVEGLLCIPK